VVYAERNSCASGFPANGAMLYTDPYTLVAAPKYSSTKITVAFPNENFTHYLSPEVK